MVSEARVGSGSQPLRLTESLLLEAVAYLAAKDFDPATVVAAFGPPPLWHREPGFPTLLLIILEQQVSLASARAAFARLRAIASPLTPAAFLTLDDGTLKGVGFSRQKSRYGRIVAQAIMEGALDLDRLNALDDDEVRAALTQLTGIGPWTAGIYLLMALCRADAWPDGDLALAKSAQSVKGLAERPTYPELHEMAEAWHPYRAVAARILWHHYLSQP